jgi:Xaa-Pro aminopeptidase
MMQRVIDITADAQINAMKFIKPGMTEYQIEALIQYTFRASSAEDDAFRSIVASGRNGGIMHYTANQSLLIPGDLVIMDIGAQYEGYAADVTRTVPVSGKFSPEQAAVYQLVLDAQTVAIRYTTKGYKFWTPHEEAFRTIGKGLTSLGIIKKWSEIGDYFIHGTSHYLGLDVHDSGIYSSLKPGELITVEPGIYIPEGSPCDPKWWNIYVRIEDDILINEGSAKVLSARAPKTIAEIEAMMNADQASSAE